MALLDKIFDPDGQVPPVARMPLEPFFGVLIEVAHGAITEGQAATVLQAVPFNLTGSDLTEAQSWITELQSLSTLADKVAYMMRSRMLCAALEQRVLNVTPSYVKTQLGF